MKTYLQAFLLLLIFTSQALAVNNIPVGWFGTFAQKKISGDYLLWAETQLRYNLKEGQNEQILYRPGILHQINSNHQLGYLYAYVQSSKLKEHRFALQHLQQYGHLLGSKFSARSRLEARFIENDPDDAARFRYLLRKDRSEIVVWDELFINLTKDSWTGNRTFDRNRFFLGLKHQLSDVRVEYGYLNQYVPRTTKDIMEHILTVYLFF